VATRRRGERGAQRLRHRGGALPKATTWPDDTGAGWAAARRAQLREDWLTPIVASLVLGAAQLARTAHAFADPINAKNAQTYMGTCSDGSKITVVANSGQSGNNMNAQTWNLGFLVAGGLKFHDFLVVAAKRGP
jgi:hypothetical protein